ncbi:14509_t:CDS:2, partial [Gigaspora margarita]
QEQLQHKTKQIQTLDEIWNIKTRDKKKTPALAYYEDILLHNLQNVKKELAKSQPYEVQRVTLVFYYFRLLLNGKKKIQALEQIVNNLWKEIQNTEYMSRCIREWVKDFLEQGTLPSHQQEKHAKRVLLLNNKDLKLAAYTWLCSILPKDHFLLVLKKELETNIFLNWLEFQLLF